MEANMAELIDAEIENTGKPKAITWAEEVPPMMDQIRFFAGAARMLEGKSAGEYVPNFTSYVRREPIGVCAQVAPWNYPLMMGVWKFIPAIAAGNTSVLKPSDTTVTRAARWWCTTRRAWCRLPARYAPAWKSPRRPPRA
jgi:betaine-aldehyde dehydrogenase